jgi:hypothetical protein
MFGAWDPHINLSSLRLLRVLRVSAEGVKKTELTSLALSVPSGIPFEISNLQI